MGLEGQRVRITDSMTQSESSHKMSIYRRGIGGRKMRGNMEVTNIRAELTLVWGPRHHTIPPDEAQALLSSQGP